MTRIAIVSAEKNHAMELFCNGKFHRKISAFEIFYVENSRFGFVAIPSSGDNGYALDIYMLEEEDINHIGVGQDFELSKLLEIVNEKPRVCYLKNGTRGLWAVSEHAARTGLLHIHRPNQDPLINIMRERNIRTMLLSENTLPLYQSGKSSFYAKIQWNYEIKTDGDVVLVEEGRKTPDTHPDEKARGQLLSPNFVRINNPTWIMCLNRGFPSFLWYEKGNNEAKMELISLIERNFK